MADVHSEIEAISRRAKAASAALGLLSSDQKNRALAAMADAIDAGRKDILAANRRDVAKAASDGHNKAFIDRLTLDDGRIDAMSASLRQLTCLADPVGEVIKAWKRPNGLWIHKVRVPLGVVAIIYESRPNVTSDCAGLCFKSGNAAILRGGSESLESNLAIYRCLTQALRATGITEDAVILVDTADRQAVDELLHMESYIDVVIPRGGESLIRRVVETSRIPVIKHYKGICHVYVDEHADLNMAQNICLNAKTQRPGTCNAMECMLVHKDVAARFLPGIGKALTEAGVEIRGDSMTQRVLKYAKAATEEDYRTEFLDLILSVKVVESLDEAIQHINTYGTRHSDAIVTEHYLHALSFMQRVDSACVYVNASTRFTDGFEFGMGAEIGISTDKLHARGPMALEELTSYKYMVFGEGQVRQ